MRDSTVTALVSVAAMVATAYFVLSESHPAVAALAGYTAGWLWRAAGAEREWEER